MVDQSSYVASENIERFEKLLLSGRLDRRQEEIVRQLLAQARAELAGLDRQRGRAAAGSRRLATVC